MVISATFSESGETITTSIPSEFTTKKPKIELRKLLLAGLSEK